MQAETFFLCLWSAIFFTAYPFVMRVTGLPAAAAGLVLHFVGFLVFIPVSAMAKVDWKMVTITAGSLAVLSGILQGFGHVFFQKIIANKEIEYSTAAITMITLNIVMAAAVAAILFGETITLRKGVGFAFATVAVWLLVKK